MRYSSIAAGQSVGRSDGECGAAHFAEQDDVHNAQYSILRRWCLRRRSRSHSDGPAARVSDGGDLAVTRWEFGLASFSAIALSRVPYHGYAGAFAAAAAAGRLLKLSCEQMQHAFGSAGTQAAGLWEFSAMPPIASRFTPRTQQLPVSLQLSRGRRFTGRVASSMVSADWPRHVV